MLRRQGAIEAWQLGNLCTKATNEGVRCITRDRQVPCKQSCCARCSLPTSCTSSVLLLRRALVRTAESAGAANAPAMQGALVCTKREWVMRWRYAHSTRQVRPYLQPPAAAGSLRPSATEAGIGSNAFCLLQDRCAQHPCTKGSMDLQQGLQGHWCLFAASRYLCS